MDLALTFSFILALGIGAQWLAWFLKQPSILFLLVVGIVCGPIFGIIDPDALLGDWLFPFISLGVAVILFEGAMTLEFHEIRNHGHMVTRLVTAGTAVTVVVMSFAAYVFFDMDGRIALLFGTLVCVTGPTVIVPMLRTVRPNSTISNILRWEGILIDPIGALLVVLVYTYIVTDTRHEPLVVFAKTLGIGLAMGSIAALCLVFLIKRYLIPEYLKNVFTLALVLLAFSVSNAIEHESGLVTVTVMGLVLANWPRFPKEEILHFKESLSVILISVLFIVLAARIDVGGFIKMGFWGGFAILVVTMAIARPLSVWLSAFGSKVTTAEKWMIMWIAPRGIVAAAVSSLFVIRLENYHLAGTELLVPLVFTLIIGTVLIQSLGAKAIARKLGVCEPLPNGVMITDGNNLALAIGKSLKENGFDVLIVNANYDAISKARMAGLKTYYGHAVSEHADRYLQLIGLGSLFAMSARSEANILAALKYRHEFGDENIYRLKNKEGKSMTTKNKTHERWQTPWLFGEQVSFALLNGLLAKGAAIKTTNLTADYAFSDYIAEKKENEQQFVPLYAISPNGELNVFSSHKQAKCTVGWKIASLVLEKQPEKQPKKNEQTSQDNPYPQSDNSLG